MPGNDDLYGIGLTTIDGAWRRMEDYRGRTVCIASIAIKAS